LVFIDLDIGTSTRCGRHDFDGKRDRKTYGSRMMWFLTKEPRSTMERDRRTQGQTIDTEVP
jgi:hypothetical protein